jgi:Polyphosphate kinase 2 (PPK2)
MAIPFKHLEPSSQLHSNIVKTRPLADLYVPRDYTGEFRVRVQLDSGQRYMGFCTEAQHQRFLDLCPQIEKYIVDGGIRLIKVWLEVGQPIAS